MQDDQCLSMHVASNQTSRKWLTVAIWLTWTIMDYHGLSWTIMDYLGLSWTIMDYHRLSQTFMDYHELEIALYREARIQ